MRLVLPCFEYAPTWASKQYQFGFWISSLSPKKALGLRQRGFFGMEGQILQRLLGFAGAAKAFFAHGHEDQDFDGHQADEQIDNGLCHGPFTKQQVDYVQIGSNQHAKTSQTPVEAADQEERQGKGAEGTAVLFHKE